MLFSNTLIIAYYICFNAFFIVSKTAKYECSHCISLNDYFSALKILIQVPEKMFGITESFSKTKYSKSSSAYILPPYVI